MLIESVELKQILIEFKDGLYKSLDRAVHRRVKEIIEGQIQILESILIWIVTNEKRGVIDMEGLKIGLGKTVKLSDIKLPMRSKLDQAIIEEASYLKDLGDARPIDISKVNVTYFINRVYHLAKDGKIHPDAKPIKAGGEIYIALKKTIKRNKKERIA